MDKEMPDVVRNAADRLNKYLWKEATRQPQVSDLEREDIFKQLVIISRWLSPIDEWWLDRVASCPLCGPRQCDDIIEVFYRLLGCLSDSPGEVGSHGKF